MALPANTARLASSRYDELAEHALAGSCEQRLCLYVVEPHAALAEAKILPLYPVPISVNTDCSKSLPIPIKNSSKSFCV